MREIKFEYGFDSVNGVVKKKYYLHEIPNIKEKCDVWNVLPVRYVRQFTGLKDKNGVDIYENDILFHENHNRKTIMKWINGYACFAGETIDEIVEQEYNFYQKIDELKLEIIGNIYQNPELL